MKTHFKRSYIAGFTLIEALAVSAIFGMVFASVMLISVNSDRSWRSGQSKITSQQQARLAIDTISRFLRSSSPDWTLNGTSYPTIISEQNARIDFFVPDFDADGNITSLRKVTFKLNPSDPSQLLMKDGVNPQVVVANNIRSVFFGAGCAGCVDFNCSSLTTTCPAVRVTVNTAVQAAQGRNATFSLTSELYLRNNNPPLSPGVTLELPGEGEF